MPVSTDVRWMGCETARLAGSWLTERTVETHIGSILAKLGLANSDEDHRRVLAVLLYLSRAPSTTPLPLQPR